MRTTNVALREALPRVHAANAGMVKRGHSMHQFLHRVLGPVAIALVAGGSAFASPFTLTASQGERAALASFEVLGSELIITLQNTSTSDVFEPTYVLTSLFFDVSGTPLVLTPISAVVPSGSTVLFGGTDPGGEVGGEWAYKSGLAGAPYGATYGLSSAGLGLVGPGDRFPGSNLQGPTSPDGLQYGITSAGDVPTTGNAPVTGDNALIRNTVVFRLSGVPSGFDPSTQIGNVAWQYGTTLADPHIPEPASVILLAVSGLLLRRFR
jgi:hypothetical protein